MFRKIGSVLIILIFFTSSIQPSASAQTAFQLPVPGTMVGLSQGFQPPMLMGMTIHPENPFLFDFIVSGGDDALEGQALQAETQKLINYFLASLTVPEDEMWVNLSPYEKDRIIAEGLSHTEMGRDMLAQDYLLKQLTASLMYPEEEIGEKFWQRVNDKVRAQYGDVEIPTNTFNKVWILPQRASVYVHDKNVFVAESHLKVMLESDYLAACGDQCSVISGQDKLTTDRRPLTTEVLREILIPEIEREVNEGKQFANLRQIFHSMILATWYKQNLLEAIHESSIHGRQVTGDKGGDIKDQYPLLSIIDQNKTVGIDINDPDMADRIYGQYVEAFEKGVYDYIKEEYDPVAQEVTSKKYFSGGVVGLKGVRENPAAARVVEALARENLSQAMVRIEPQLRDGSSAAMVRGEDDGVDINQQGVSSWIKVLGGSLPIVFAGVVLLLMSEPNDWGDPTTYQSPSIQTHLKAYPIRTEKDKVGNTYKWINIKDREEYRFMLSDVGTEISKLPPAEVMKVPFKERFLLVQFEDHEKPHDHWNRDWVPMTWVDQKAFDATIDMMLKVGMVHSDNPDVINYLLNQLVETASSEDIFVLGEYDLFAWYRAFVKFNDVLGPYLPPGKPGIKEHLDFLSQFSQLNFKQDQFGNYFMSQNIGSSVSAPDIWEEADKAFDEMSPKLRNEWKEAVRLDVDRHPENWLNASEMFRKDYERYVVYGEVRRDIREYKFDSIFLEHINLTSRANFYGSSTVGQRQEFFDQNFLHIAKIHDAGHTDFAGERLVHALYIFKDGGWMEYPTSPAMTSGSQEKSDRAMTAEQKRMLLEVTSLIGKAMEEKRTEISKLSRHLRNDARIDEVYNLSQLRLFHKQLDRIRLDQDVYPYDLMVRIGDILILSDKMKMRLGAINQGVSGEDLFQRLKKLDMQIQGIGYLDNRDFISAYERVYGVPFPEIFKTDDDRESPKDMAERKAFLRIGRDSLIMRLKEFLKEDKSDLKERLDNVFHSYLNFPMDDRSFYTAGSFMTEHVFLSANGGIEDGFVGDMIYKLETVSKADLVQFLFDKFVSELTEPHIQTDYLGEGEEPLIINEHSVKEEILDALMTFLRTEDQLWQYYGADETLSADLWEDLEKAWDIKREEWIPEGEEYSPEAIKSLFRKVADKIEATSDAAMRGGETDTSVLGIGNNQEILTAKKTVGVVLGALLLHLSAIGLILRNDDVDEKGLPASPNEDQKTSLTVLTAESDPAMNAAVDAPGGIDFNPGAMELTTEGGQINFQMDPVLMQNLDPDNVIGATPVIIQITPLTNYFPLLGLETPDEHEREGYPKDEEPRLANSFDLLAVKN